MSAINKPLMSPYEIECAKAVVNDGASATTKQYSVCADHCPHNIKIATVGAGVILAAALEDAEERIKALEKLVGGENKWSNSKLHDMLEDHEFPLKSIE